MNSSTYQISPELFLTQQIVTPIATTVVNTGTNHVLVVDCSGSMSGELHNLRTHLKNKLSSLLDEKDTVSIVWFSGRGEFGTLIEGETVAGLSDLKRVHAVIDRWLRPVGLTSFLEPIQEVGNLVSRISSKNNNPFSLFFLSDGYDNVNNRASVLKAVEATAAGLAAATFVEFGLYADRPLLTAMAEKSGGSLIFANDFVKYEAELTNTFKKTLSSAKKVKVAVPEGIIGNFVFAFTNTELLTFLVEDETVTIPEDVTFVCYLRNTHDGGKLSKVVTADLIYAAISLYSCRMRPDVVRPLLKFIGDVHFIEQFAQCFGKQQYTKFMEATKEAVFGKGRMLKGYNPSLVPADDAFTVLDMLKVLSEDEGNRLLLDSDDFKYNRIGRTRDDANTTLTKQDEEELDVLKEQLANEKDLKVIQQIILQMAAITDKPKALKFLPDFSPDGYEISSLVYNEERPNISVNVKKLGVVDLSSRPIPSGVAPFFDTFIYRSYSIVKDGFVNVDTLPVTLTPKTRALLEEEVLAGRLAADVVDGNLIHLDKLPIINAKFTKQVSFFQLFGKEWELLKLRAEKKVVDSVYAELYPKGPSAGFKMKYGEEAAKWLAEQGFTEYSGFSPKSVTAEATDFYMGKELQLKIKGFSALPSLNDVRKRIKDGNLTPSASLMVPYLNDIESLQKKFDAESYKFLLEARSKELVKQIRAMICEMAQVRFAIIVGQIWFYEMGSIEENSKTIELGGAKVLCTAELAEKKFTI